MATNGVSGATSRTSGVSSSTKKGNSTQQILPAVNEGSGEAKSSRPTATQRQLINIDGKIFDRRARRGTYLDILV